MALTSVAVKIEGSQSCSNERPADRVRQKHLGPAARLDSSCRHLRPGGLGSHPTRRLARCLAHATQLEALSSSDEKLIKVTTRDFADGGKIIGRLERLLIYLFVLSDALGAVDFLIAAKSIFRFGELSNQSNRLEAEYITIGTLMSFAVGLAIALGVQCLLV